MLAVLTFLFGTASCRGTGDPVKVRAIDSLLVHVDDLLLELGTIDLSRFTHMDSTFRTSRRQAIEDLLRDTLDRREALLVGDHFRAMDQSVPQVLEGTPRAITELEHCKQQLKDLRHDIDHGLLPEGSMDTYFDQESLAVDQADRSVRTLFRNAEVADSCWAIRAGVDSLITAHTGQHPQRP